MKVRTLVLVSSIAIIVAISSAFVLKVATTEKVDAKAFEDLKSFFIKSSNSEFELSEKIFLDRKKANDLEWLNKGSKNLSVEYKAFLPFLKKSPAFSRMPTYYGPVQMLETDKYFAFIYRKTRGFSNISYDNFFVSVLDKKGQSVHHEEITGNNGNDIVVAFKIDKDLILTRKFFKEEWIATKSNEFETEQTLTFLSENAIDLKEYNSINIQEEEDFAPKAKLPKKKEQVQTESSTRAK